MGRSPCCENKMGLKKGPWTPEEDQKLLAYIQEHGHGNWRALPLRAGLQRCGKSCRLRWTNYLRPDIKRGKFSLQEEQTIIQLHALLGNRWSAIATHLPKRTDNEIKNYWNTHLKKRLTKMGIDPVTHKPRNDTLVPVSEGGPQQCKNVANLSHMAQWESARLEAEARLARQSKLRSNAASFTSWPGNNNIGAGGIGLLGMDSPTTTLSFIGNGGAVTEFIRHHHTNDSNYTNCDHQGIIKEENNQQEWNSMSFNQMTLSIDEGGHDKDGVQDEEDDHPSTNRDFIEGFTELLLSTTSTTTTTTTTTPRTSNSSGKRVVHDDQGTIINGDSSESSDRYEDNKNYWNSILNLVESSPLHSSVF